MKKKNEDAEFKECCNRSFGFGENYTSEPHF